MEDRSVRLYEAARMATRDVGSQLHSITHIENLIDGPQYDDLMEEAVVHLSLLVRRGIRTVSMLYESLGFADARRAFADEMAAFENLAKIQTYEQDSDYTYSPINERLKEHLETFEAVLDAGSVTEAERQVLTRLLGQVAHVMHKRGKVPTKEHDVQNEIHTMLLGPWPDVVREPPIAQQTKVYKPDFGIESISAAIEVKFLSDQKDVGTLLGSIYEDMMGYAGSHWQSFQAVIYATGAFTTQAVLDAEARKVGTPKSWSTTLVIGAGAKTGKTAPAGTSAGPGF